MDYSLQQRGRASVEFLVDLGIAARRLESRADRFAADMGLTADALPASLDELHAHVTPLMQQSPDFRVFRMLREWQLDRHGWIGREAFDEISADIEERLRRFDSGPTTLAYAELPVLPDYWDGYEFHRTAGGWDGHPCMACCGRRQATRRSRPPCC